MPERSAQARCAVAAGPLRPFPLPGDTPHYAPDRVADIRHYRLDLAVDVEQRSINGRCTLEFSPLGEGIQHLGLDAVEMRIDSVVDERGRALQYDYDGARLTVRFPRRLAAGRRHTVTVAYGAHPRRGLYFIAPDELYPDRPRQLWSQGQDEDSRHWFPCHDFPNEKATSELIVTVPAGWTAVGNGRLVERSEDRAAGTATYHWQMDVPHVTYLLSVAAGDFSELQADLPDLPVRYYVQRAREPEAQRTLERTPRMIREFERLIGVKYPYPQYLQTFVAEFIFGGMENIGATTLTDTVLLDERAAIDRDADDLVSHELAHQWFGDLLTCREWAHAWLNEGFASFMEIVWREAYQGADEAAMKRWEDAQVYFSETGRYGRPIVSNVYNEPIDIFDRHLYEKGALVLHMLRRELGDRLFWRSVRHYVSRHREGVVTTPDLQRAIEEATGRTLDWFFDQWVYKAGHPDFKVEWSWDDTTSSARLTARQAQDTSDGTVAVFRADVPVDFRWDGGSQQAVVHIRRAEESLYVKLPKRPTLVRFDPGNHLLKTVEFKKGPEELVEQLRSDPDVIGRVRAAQDLGKLGSHQAVEALARAVRQDTHWAVQAEAARALGDVRTAEALDRLTALLDVPHPKGRRGVVSALGQFLRPRAAEALTELLRHGDPSYFVEAEAARSLGRTRQPGAFEALAEVIRTRESWQDVVRQLAFEGLGALLDERAVPLAKEWSAPGKSWQARVAAIGLLGRLGEDKKHVVEYLATLLDDPDLRVRQAATVSLAACNDAAAVPALRRLAARDLDGRVIRRAREAIAQIQEGKRRGEDVQRLRDDVERLQKENADLRQRLEKLEALAQPPAGGDGAAAAVRTPAAG